jgi:Cu-Zn family superoxide dismutase
MNKIGKLFLCVFLVACGSSSSSHHATAPTTSTAMAPAPKATPAPSMPENDDSTLASTTPDTGYGAGSASSATATDATPATAGTQMPSTTAAPTPSTDQTVAKAELKSVKDGSSMGTITFTKGDNGQIQIEGTFTGLGKDGVHALYIHENGDCSAKAKKVGKDLNPTHSKWGPPSSASRHAGDFGNVTADDSGNATFTMTTDSITFDGDRPDGIVNRAIVIHVKKDAKSGVGGALACGVITMQ